MKTFVCDANVPWGFRDAKKLELLLDFFKSSECQLLMAKENYDECPRTIRDCLDKHVDSCFECCDVDNGFLRKVASDCRTIYKEIHGKGNNDYAVIALAIEKKSDFLVTNDFDLINAAVAYKKHHNIPKEEIIIMKVANLIRFMYDSRRDLITHKEHINTNVKFFHHVEMPNIYRGVSKFEWTKDMVKDRFLPYSSNIYHTLETVNWTKM